MTWKTMDWLGCYKRGWPKGLLLAESYAHHAKVAYGLTERIYAFLFERGLLAPGMTVIDPFAGVGGFAFHAMKAGLNFRGVELEPRFVELADESYPCPGFDKPFWRRFFGRAVIVEFRKQKLLCPSCETAMTPKTKLDKRTGKIIERRIPERPAHIYRGNLPLWQHKYGDKLPGWGTAHIVQGDSRRLRDVLAEADCVTTSPPFGAAQDGGGLNKNWPGGDTFTRGGGYPSDLHGSAPGNLGNLPARSGDLDAAITSPPYADQQLNDRQRKAQDTDFNLEQPQTYNAAISSPPFLQTSGGSNVTSASGPLSDAGLIARHAAGNAAAHGYGESESNLGNMREGEIDSAITSPPYANIPVTPGNSGNRMMKETWGQGKGLSVSDSYGDSPAQLSNLPEGAVDAEITSPPYEHSLDDGHRNNTRTDGTNYTYSTADSVGQVGMMWGDTFWAASRQILEQTFALLCPHVPGQPGGVAVFVCKRYVRDGEIIEFSDNWRRLAESVGFRTLYWIRAWLTTDDGTQLAMDGHHKRYKKKRVSFFRRLHENKRPELAIDWEDVIVMEKPL